MLVGSHLSQGDRVGECVSCYLSYLIAHMTMSSKSDNLNVKLGLFVCIQMG